MFYFDILKGLFEADVKYLVVGGLAVNLHGLPRMTSDLDIVLYPEKENILKAVEVFSKLGYVPLQPINPYDLASEEKRSAWIREKNMLAFNFHKKDADYRSIDVVIKCDFDLEVAFKNAETRRAGGIEICLAPIDSIIEMKSASGRLHDKSDVAALETIKTIKYEK